MIHCLLLLDVEVVSLVLGKHVNFKEVSEMETRVYWSKPHGYIEEASVSGCLIQTLHRPRRALFVQRNPHKLWGGLWGVPSGTREEGESDRETCLREVFEETGCTLKAQSVRPVSVCWVYPAKNQGVFRYRLYRAIVPSEFEPVLPRQELVAYEWLTVSVARVRLALVPGMREVLEGL